MKTGILTVYIDIYSKIKLPIIVDPQLCVHSTKLHLACQHSGDQGGSVECVKTVLSFYDDEKEQEALWQKLRFI